ncbi:MAG TPA: hypothetical protein VI033_01430 [Candidatus Nitrosopolaris sp.]
MSTIYYCIIDTVNNTFVDKGDCYDGPAPESPPPIVGDRLKVTGAYATDIREIGHAEIHPPYAISRIS